LRTRTERMQPRVGDVLIESVTAESPKFTAPMLLIPGLWCAAAAWRKFMGYLAHRGWNCHALTLRGRRDSGAGSARFADELADVHAVIAACEAPPVLLGHDLGGLLALAANSAAVRAIGALAPIVPRACAVTAHPALSGWHAWVGRRWGRLPPPHGHLGAVYFGGAVPAAAAPTLQRSRASWSRRNSPSQRPAPSRRCCWQAAAIDFLPPAPWSGWPRGAVGPSAAPRMPVTRCRGSQDGSGGSPMCIAGWCKRSASRCCCRAKRRTRARASACQHDR